MKIAKEHIQLSPAHPTLLATPDREAGIYAPVVVSEQRILVDGYRRFFLQDEVAIEAVIMPTQSIFQTAVMLNLRSRRWDEIDSLLWTRWAKHLGVESTRLPSVSFPTELLEAPDPILASLAGIKISVRQAVSIQQLPTRHHSFFLNLLGSEVRLNSNETISLLEWVYDLMNRNKMRNPADLLNSGTLAEILADGRLNPKQRGELLLKEIRKLRYPMYQERFREFSDSWNQLDVGSGIQARKELFLQRGVLEVTITATSQEEFQARLKRLSDRVNSAGWSRIWKE